MAAAMHYWIRLPRGFPHLVTSASAGGGNPHTSEPQSLPASLCSTARRKFYASLGPLGPIDCPEARRGRPVAPGGPRSSPGIWSTSMALVAATHVERAGRSDRPPRGYFSFFLFFNMGHGTENGEIPVVPPVRYSTD
jgi:hypothetical protein